MKSLSTAARVGIFTVVSLIILVIIVTWKSDFFLMREGYHVVGVFQNVEGLTAGSEVRYRGMNIGKVVKIDPSPKEIFVYLVVKKHIKIPVDSTMRVSYDGIVGTKFLEIRPGTQEVYLKNNDKIPGKSAAGVVDFIDMGAKSLEEANAILESVKEMIQNPQIAGAFKAIVLSTQQLTENLNKLTQEIRETNAGIQRITTDPKFQESVVNIADQTSTTLTSANQFFGNIEQLKVRTSGDVLYGSSSNTIKGNLDIYLSDPDYLRFGLGGVGQTQGVGVLDVLLSRGVTKGTALHLGMINTTLGGGIDYVASPNWIISGDIYDINNPKPNVPKFRVTSTTTLFSRYVDLMLQADDVFNPQRNYSFGVKVKGGF